MSDLRIALVAEGSTDYEIIHAALKAILATPFVLTLLQPEPMQPHIQGGWGGVLKWCHSTGLRHTGSLDTDPTLAQFDVLIIHLDADVAHMHYSDCGSAVDALAQQLGWASLPCSQACPPAAAACLKLRIVLASWLGRATLGRKTALCLPAQSIGTWLAAAVLPEGHALLNGAECDVAVERQLALLPLKQRIKKSTVAYRQRAPQVFTAWEKVKNICGQAQVFEDAVREAL